MSKLLVVFGVSGNQGGSVANFVVNDPELAKEFKVRGITRDPSKPAMKELETKGVEIAKGDIQDEPSVKKALQGAHTVFLMTSSEYSRESKQVEIDQGKRVANAAVAAGVKWIIFSSVPSPATISNGRLTKVNHFESKYEIEQYIKTLPIGSAFFAPGSFMQNYQRMMGPHPEGDGTYAISNIFNAYTEIPLVDVTDTGKWIGAILAAPDKYNHKVFDAATRLYTMQEIVDIMSKVTGKKVMYKQIPDGVFKSFLPRSSQEMFLQMLQYFRDYGYYGANQKALVEWAAKQARGKPTTLEEYLQKEPLKLE